MSQLFQGLAYKPVFAPSSPPSLLSDSDSVSALSWDPVKQVLAVANGTTVDIGETFGGRTFSIVSSITVGETIVAVSLYDGAMFVATPTKGLYYPDFNVDAPQTISTAGIVDGLLWSTAQDSNPDWPSEVFTSYQTEAESATRGPGANFPDLFLIEAIATEVTIYDVSSGVPVMWMVFEGVTDNMLTTSSNSALSYTDGVVYVGSVANGAMPVFNFVDDTGRFYTAGSGRDYNGNIEQRNDTLGFTVNPAYGTIVNDTVNDVASTVLSSVPTTNELDATEDWTDAYWTKTEITVDGDIITDNAVTNRHSLISQNDTAATASSPYTFSVTLEEVDDCQWASLDVTDLQFGEMNVWVDVRNGTILNIVSVVEWGNVTAHIEPDGAGYRVSLSGTKSVSTGVSARVNMMAQAAGQISYSGTGSKLRVTNPQLEQSATLHDYVPSVTGPTTGTTPSAKQLVNRTNLLTDSKRLDIFYTNVVRATMEFQPDTIGPDGEPGVNFMRSDGTAAVNHNAGRISVPTLIPAPADTWFTYTVSLKSVGTDGSALLEFGNGANSGNVAFNLLAGTIDAPNFGGTITDAKAYLEDEGGGWYRASLAILLGPTWTGNINVAQYDTDSTTASTEVGFLCTEGQIETGSQPTPFIFTEADPATVTDDTGLFVPTWAVATGSVNSGGLGSCGLDTGNIIDYNQVGNHSNGVEFLEQGDLLWNFSASSITCRIPVKDADVPTTSTDPDARLFSVSPFGTSPAVLKILQALDGEAFVQGEGLAANATMDDGIGIINDNSPDEVDAVYTRITTTYNTGGMKQPDGAWANDTGTDPIGFPFDLNDDFDEPDVTVFSDDFNRTDPAPWIPVAGSVEDAAKVSLTISAGRARLENIDNAGFNCFGSISRATVVGEWYKVSAAGLEVVSGPSTVAIEARDNLGDSGNVLGKSQEVTAGPTDVDFTFQAVGTTTYFDVRDAAGVIGTVSEWDDYLIEEVPALDGWTAEQDAALSVVAGRMQVESTVAASYASKIITTEVGKNYTVTVDYIEVDLAASEFRVGSNLGNLDLTGSGVLSGSQSIKLSFTATGTTTYLSCRNGSGTAGLKSQWDNITVQESLVENPTFDSSTTGWDASGVTLASVSGELEVTSAVGVFTWQQLTLEVGKPYRLSGTGRLGTQANGDIRVGNTAASSDYLAIPVSGGGTVIDETFVPTQTTIFVSMGGGATGALTTYWDNIIVTEALPDNSGQDNHMQVIGQVTRVEYENTGMYGVCVDDKNYLIGQSSKNVTGRVKYGDGDWTPFNGLHGLKYTSQGGGTFELRGAAQGTVDYQTCYFEIVAGDAIGGALGGVQYQDGTAFPAFVTRGLPFASSYTLAVDSTNPITYHHQGLPFVASGRIAADLTGPVDRIAPGNVPLSAAGRVVILNTASDHVAAAVIYDTDSAVVGV